MRRLLPGALYERYWHTKRSLRNLLDTALVLAGCLPADPVTPMLDSRLYDDSSPDSSHYPAGVICICDGSFHHGGTTDRLRGILSSYAIARARKIPFFISCTHPFLLEGYLVPAEVDWRIKPEEISRSRKVSRMVVVDDLSDFQSALRLRAAFRSRKKQLHLYTNADTSRGSYSRLFSELFRPSEALARQIERHRRALRPVYHAFSFRFLTLLGDFKDVETQSLSPEEQEALMSRVREELKRMIEDVPSDASILLASDSARFLEYVRDLDRRIYICDGEIRHLDRDPEATEDSVMRTFVDQFLLMGASRVTLMRTGGMYRSGFPRFAAEVGGAEFIDHRF